MIKLELRLAALSKLLDVKSEAVEKRLIGEFTRVTRTLQESVEYDELSEALKTLAVLAPRFHMTMLPVLDEFVRLVSTRTLIADGVAISNSRFRYRSPGRLIREAIEVAESLRYLHPEQVIDFLLAVTRAGEEDVMRQAEQALEALATFNLDVFYGEPPLGAEPQVRMVSHLATFDDDALRISARVILRSLGRILSPTIEGISSTFNSIMIRRGSITSDGDVAAVRSGAITLAKRMYWLESSIDHRKRVLSTLDSATRREGKIGDLETSSMFERDAVTVLEFYRDLVATEPLPLVQSIEHQAYWDYHHGASLAIKGKALEVRDAVDTHHEYQIYKQLIGFEGIFGNWEDLSHSDEAWDYSDSKRHEAARRYLREIDDTTYEKWRDRILEFSKTRSDDLAMFPVYHDFLESIGRERSHLALELLTAHESVMEPFLIALMRGLWTSENLEPVEEIAMSWIADGRHLAVIAKSLYKVGAEWLDVLAVVVERASALDDRNALIELMGVAARLFAEGATDAKPIFMRSLRELSKHDDASWVSVIWFSRDIRALVSTMNLHERTEVLAALSPLPELDYRAEELLYEIAQHDLQGTVHFLVGRLERARLLAQEEREADDHVMDRFQPIPYRFQKLGGLLARAPDVLLSAIRSEFDREVRSLFSFRGARLVKLAFPTFEEPLESLLLHYVWSAREGDVEFVIGILQCYEGSTSILDVCKAIIRVVPERSRIWNEVAAAIEATGLVSGEYGIVEAFERKKQEIAGWGSDEDERVQAFSKWLTEDLESRIEHERQRADSGLALRKYRFGADKDDG